MARGSARASRLSIVFALVAAGIAVSASLLALLGIGFDELSVLLPIFVLASLVGRLATVFDEVGAPIAAYRLGWTLAVATRRGQIVRNKPPGHVLVRFPGLHPITLDAILAPSPYTARRLARWPGFALVAVPRKPARGKRGEMLNRSPR